jgi:AcrR family transcriptional regulator
MKREQRRQKQRDIVREDILDRARELFVSNGFEDVSMRQIAERVECSPGTIYLHFPDKEALFRELCHRDFAQLVDAFRRVKEIADPIKRLRSCMRAYIQFAVDHPNHYRFMFLTSHPVELTGEELARRGNPRESAYGFLLSLVRSAIDAGAFRADYRNAKLIAQTLWAAAHGVASLQIARANDPWIVWEPLQERSTAMIDGMIGCGFARKRPHDPLAPRSKQHHSPRRPANRKESQTWER